MSEPRKLTVDERDEDHAWVERFVERVDELAHMVIEMHETTPQLVLSPVFRQMLVEKARALDDAVTLCRYRLHVDNPAEPLVPIP